MAAATNRGEPAAAPSAATRRGNDVFNCAQVKRWRGSASKQYFNNRRFAGENMLHRSYRSLNILLVPVCWQLAVFRPRACYGA